MLNAPYLITNDRKINRAFRIAIATLFGNIFPFKDGLLEEAKPVILAGLGYSTPWTRDASINTWNAGGLLCPEVAKNTLKSVISKNDKGYIIAGEYWDRIIWATGAWYLYLFDGDKNFLKIAYDAVCNSLEEFENTEFSTEINLFRGPACYGDGVAAYPDVYSQHGTSAIIDFTKYNKDLCVDKGVGIPMYVLSTNCLYYNAYVVADKMAEELGVKGKYQIKAQKMYEAINKIFWNESKGTYNYIYDDFGGCDSQEGLGISFAILFGLADDEKKEKIFKNYKTSNFGIPCVYPSFSRYDTPDGLGFGRHSGTVWPHVQGFWADAAATNNNKEIFDKEFLLQTENAMRYFQFAEIYHPTTGEIYGGRQERGNGIVEWDSEPFQTWSATAYIRNILFDILGLKFDVDGIVFKPIGLKGLNKIQLSGLKYRNMELNIFIEGEGNNIKNFMINGLETKPFISKELSGKLEVQIILGE